MPIIRDGKTPNGRLVKCRPTATMPSQCVTRKMTEEERAFYGEAIPPSEWKKHPKYGSVVVEGKPKPKKVTFRDDDDFRWMGGRVMDKFPNEYEEDKGLLSAEVNVYPKTEWRDR